MLSMDKEAIKELTEMEAVPICNILGSLLQKREDVGVKGGGDRHGLPGRGPAPL